MLSINNVEVIYSEVILVLKGISMEVPPEHIVALLGPNGAGKTTTLKAISGLLKNEEGKVSDGSIELDGNRLDKKSPEEIVKIGIVQAMEGHRVFQHLTVQENLYMGAYTRSDHVSVRKDLGLILDYFPKLRDLMQRTAGYLSGGEQQMLIIGRSLMSKPKIMLLDEPSLGLAPFLVKEIFQIIPKINEEQKTSFLLVEQNANAALNICQHGYVMENGTIVIDGPAEKLKDNEDVQEFYLGFGSLSQRRSYREVKHYKRRKRWLT